MSGASGTSDSKDNPQSLGELVPKKGVMYLTLLIFWFLILLWFNPRLFSLFSEAHSLSARMTLVLFIFCLNIFWLLGIYYIMLFVFTFLSKKPVILPPLKPSEQPKVAILYLTMNDFQYQAAFSCLNQSYQNCRLFILDDSTEQNKMREVDHFREKFPDKVTVIRRGDRKGFKAGSINNALQNHILDFPYFAVLDSDGIVPKDFLERMIPYFGTDEHIGFVQGSHRPNPIQKSKFAADMALGIIPLWTVYNGPRNDYGFVIFLGHGGVIRRDVWEEVGGFPEIVSEDLAFTSKIAERGYRGYFVSNVISYEDFPETYSSLRKQQEKYVKGGCEYLHKYFFAFWKSKKIKWFEKMDVVLFCSTLLLPAFYLFFLFVFSLMMPYFFAEARPLHLSFFGSQISIGPVYLLRESFNHSIWKWDFYFVTILMMFSPVLGCFKLLLSQPKETIRLLFLSTVPYLSLMVLCSMSILTYVITGKAAFLVTADKKDDHNFYSYLGKRERFRLEGLNFKSRSIRIIELIIGIFFTYACLRTVNLCLLSFSLSLILGYFIYNYEWGNKILMPFVYLPFFFIIFAIGLSGFNLIGAQGIFFSSFAIHF